MIGRRAKGLLSTFAAALIAFALAVPAAAQSARPNAPPAKSAAQSAYDKGDYATARKLWEEACEAGSPVDCYELGIVYRDGEGVAPYRERYIALITRACDADIATACYNLGHEELRAVETGRGTVSPEQLSKGLAFYRRACTLGQTKACTNLYLHLSREAATGDGTALADLRQLCVDGTGAACFGLASLYDIHLDAKLGNDPEAANAALLLGCERMDYDSCQNLAWHYDHGFGLETNKVRGAALYHLACDDDPGFLCPMVRGSAIAASPDRKAPVQREWQRAAGAYRAACDDGLAMGCFGYARLIAKSGRGKQEAETMRSLLSRALTLSPGMPIATELLRRVDAGELPAAPLR